MNIAAKCKNTEVFLMKTIVKKVSALTAALTATIAASIIETFALDINDNNSAVTMLATGNPFQSVADWLNSWTDQAKVLVPAVGTLIMLVIGLVLMFAGGEWSRKAKTFAGAIIAGIAVISYGPLLISSMLAQ